MKIYGIENYAKQIKDLFPLEELESYYIPRQNGKNPKGKLYNRNVNVVQKYDFSPKKMHFKSAISCTSIEEDSCSMHNVENQLPQQELEDLKELLRNDFEDCDKVKSNWEKTNFFRRSLILKSPASISSILLDWPLYKNIRGHELIEIDFEKLYLNRSSLLCTKWEVAVPLIKNYYKDCVSNSEAKKLLNKLESATSEDSRNAILILLLSSVLKPTRVSLKKGIRKFWKPSIIEGQISMILYINQIKNLERKLTLLREKYCKIGLTLQPLIIVVVEILRKMRIEQVVYKWYEKLAMEIIRKGPIPKHVAFIMDGNRRFAKESNMSRQDGHTIGGNKLIEYLNWCFNLGVRETTVYGFSVENFNRSEKEVDELMELFMNVLGDHLGKFRETVKEDGIRVRVIGNITLLPAELQKRVAKMIIATEGNSKFFLNIALAYSSQEEITNSIQTILNDGGENLQASDINEELLRQCLYTGVFMSEPDLIRSSGNTRISDFLMWQISSTGIYFAKPLWPALTIVDFALGILYYQRSTANLSEYRQEHLQNQMKLKEDFPERVHHFLRKVDERQRDFILKLANEK